MEKTEFITKKQSINKINLQKWVEKGNKIPICINNGCYKTVAIRHWSAQGDPSLKTECFKCSNYRIKNKKLWELYFIKKIIVKIKIIY